MSLLGFNIFTLISNIPLLLFDFLLFFIFLLVIRAVIIIISSGKNELRLESGKRNLLAAFFWLFLLLAGASIFSFITTALQGPARGDNGEFPSLPGSDFPAGPEFVKISNYYFSGPWPLRDRSLINEAAIFAIACKKENSYGIIAISETKRENLLANKQYDCWVSNCEGGQENLYLAVIYTKSENFSQDRIEEIKTDLEGQFGSLCKDTE